MRYVSTFHPSQNHLHPSGPNGRGCVQTHCWGVSRRKRGFVVVLLTYVVCILGNIPSFYLFRATPLSTASLFENLTSGAMTTTTDNNASELLGDRQLMTFAVDDDDWIDFTATQSNLSDGPPSNASRSTTTASPSDHGHEYLLIDLGPFSHDTRPGYVFHWIKWAMGFFVPGILLTFFNIRLIQALRRSERPIQALIQALRRSERLIKALRRSERLRRAAAYHSSPSSGNVRSMMADTPKTARATASRNRLNATLVAVIVMLVVLVYPCEFLDFVVHLGPLGKTRAVDEEAMMLTRMILNALQLSNFALNFFLYCTLNAQFRRAFVDWFCRRGRHRRRDVRRAALGVVDPVVPPPRRDVEVFRASAGGVRHTPRHDDLRANQRLSGSVGARSQRSSESDVGPQNLPLSHRPAGSNNAMARLSGSRGSHLSNARSSHSRRSGSQIV